MLFLFDTPIPKDIPLPLPLPEWLLVFLLVFSFLLHIIFINLMVGGSIVVLWAQIKGIKDHRYDIFAHEIAKTITVNKSIAVVLGVAPLLSINTLYAVYFYSANALTGFWWILIIPLVTIAFLLTYLHKYTWEQLEQHKWVHISTIALSVAIFLLIPLIFLTNVNLMMFPEQWGNIKGFLSALFLPNVFPRYFEFLGACLAGLLALISANADFKSVIGSVGSGVEAPGVDKSLLFAASAFLSSLVFFTIPIISIVELF